VCVVIQCAVVDSPSITPLFSRNACPRFKIVSASMFPCCSSGANRIRSTKLSAILAATSARSTGSLRSRCCRTSSLMSQCRQSDKLTSGRSLRLSAWLIGGCFSSSGECRRLACLTWCKPAMARSATPERHSHSGRRRAGIGDSTRGTLRRAHERLTSACCRASSVVLGPSSQHQRRPLWSDARPFLRGCTDFSLGHAHARVGLV
jgi:hypothetical protein